jgi:hypothetical protein
VLTNVSPDGSNDTATDARRKKAVAIVYSPSRFDSVDPISCVLRIRGPVSD